MKSPSSKLRFYFIIAAIIVLAMIATSCENKIPAIPKSDLLILPSLTGKQVKMVMSDSGRIQLIMTTPLVEKYDKVDPPYAEFKAGMKVVLFNKQNDSVIVTQNTRSVPIIICGSSETVLL